VSDATVGPRAAWRVIRSRDFGPYFIGNAASASGMWFHNLAASLLVYRLTGSELLLGLLNFSQFAWIVLLAPWAGALADQYDRRKVLLASQVGATILSAGIAVAAFADALNEWSVIAVTLFLGLASAVAAPSQQALVVSLVEPRDLATAVPLNSMTFNLARAVGPALAALVIATLGIPAAFAINTASYLIFVVALMFVRARPTERSESPKLRESFRLLRNDPVLIAYLLIIVVVGYGMDPINTLAPAFADSFGYADTVAGFIVGAFGAGAVTAAVLLAGRTAGSAARMAITLGLLGGGMVGFSLSPWLPLGFVFLFIAGFGFLASGSSAMTRLQLAVTDGQRGRIMALWGIAFLGVRPIASLLDGAIAAVANVRVAGIALALPALAGAAVILLWPRLRVSPLAGRLNTSSGGPR
jgi:MFS family permease